MWFTEDKNTITQGKLNYGVLQLNRLLRKLLAAKLKLDLLREAEVKIYSSCRQHSVVQAIASFIVAAVKSPI
jgi:hypothetical protein